MEPAGMMTNNNNNSNSNSSSAANITSPSTTRPRKRSTSGSSVYNDGSVHTGMFDYNLYGDLADIGHNNELLRLQSELSEVVARITVWGNDGVELLRQLEAVLQEKKRLEENVCVIYNTAMRELARKDREIERLSRGSASSSVGPPSIGGGGYHQAGGGAGGGRSSGSSIK
jgi:hypothetical protein